MVSRIGCAVGVLSCLLVTASPATAAKVVFASDGTPAGVEAALAALGGPGVVVLPAGDFVFDKTVSIPYDDVTLLGAGSERTRLYRAKDAADPAVANAPYLKANGKDRLRIAHLAIEGVAVSGSAASERGIVIQNGLDFRVDHTDLSFIGFAAVYTSGESRGVVDHNVIHDGYKPAIGNYGYGVCVMGTGAYSNLPFGSPEATFAEDNRVVGARHAAASNNAARYVFRYNHVSQNENSHGVDAHGDEYNSTDTGTEWIEVHHNTLEAPIHKSAAVRIRGGKGIVWANSISDYTYGVSLWNKTPQTTGPVYVWQNILSPGVTLMGDLQGTVSYKLASAPGYTPYAYPHPLVSDLEPDGGPDLFVWSDGATAKVYLDSSASSADQGTVEGHAWRLDDDAVVSTCARDVVDLPIGTHLALLEATRSDGHTEFDTAHIRVLPNEPLVSSAAWSRRDFVPIVGKGSLSFEVVPKSNTQDAYVGFAGRHPVAAHGDEAVIVRTNNAGTFDVRNGSAYDADAVIAYEAGKTYLVTIELDVATQTYDVSVDGKALAKGYAFRRPETSIARLDAWHGAGSLTVSSFAYSGELAEPDAGCAKEPPPSGTGGAGGGEATSGAGGTGGGSGGGGLDSTAVGSGGGSSSTAAGAGAVPSAIEASSSCTLGRGDGRQSDARALVAVVALAAWSGRRRTRASRTR